MLSDHYPVLTTKSYYHFIILCRASSTKLIRYLKQGVSLTGLGTPLFDSSIQAIMDIYALFCRSVPRDKLQPCSFMDHYGQYTAIEMSNRFFSPRKDFPMSKSIPFSADVDPKGILARAIGTSFIHMEQNVVAYYERSMAPNGNTRCVEQIYKTINYHWTNFVAIRKSHL